MTAATAASVGVNQPSVMPPIRMTGAISAITAEKSKYQSSASSATRPMPTAMFTEEQSADRDVRHHAVDHERQRWRNDRAERGGRRRHADRELGGVAVILHRLDFDGAEPRGVGNCGAGHAGKDHGAYDIDVAEAAAHPAHQRHREF